MKSHIELAAHTPNPVVVDGALKNLAKETRVTAMPHYIPTKIEAKNQVIKAADTVTPPPFKFASIRIPMSLVESGPQEKRVPLGTALWTQPVARVDTEGNVSVEVKKLKNWSSVHEHIPTVFVLPSRVPAKSWIPEVPIERWHERQLVKRRERRLETLESMRTFKERRAETKRLLERAAEKRSIIANPAATRDVQHLQKIGSSRLKHLSEISRFRKAEKLLVQGAASAALLTSLAPYILAVETVNALSGGWYVGMAASLLAVTVGALAQMRASKLDSALLPADHTRKPRSRGFLGGLNFWMKGPLRD